MRYLRLIALVGILVLPLHAAQAASQALFDIGDMNRPSPGMQWVPFTLAVALDKDGNIDALELWEEDEKHRSEKLTRFKPGTKLSKFFFSVRNRDLLPVQGGTIEVEVKTNTGKVLNIAVLVEKSGGKWIASIDHQRFSGIEFDVIRGVLGPSGVRDTPPKIVPFRSTLLQDPTQILRPDAPRKKAHSHAMPTDPRVNTYSTKTCNAQDCPPHGDGQLHAFGAHIGIAR